MRGWFLVKRTAYFRPYLQEIWPARGTKKDEKLSHIAVVQWL